MFPKVVPGVQVDVQKVLGPERRISRVEREEELVNRAMRKRSRKVRQEQEQDPMMTQVSREGDFLVSVEKVGVLTTQAGTQQVATQSHMTHGTVTQ